MANKKNTSQSRDNLAIANTNLKIKQIARKKGVDHIEFRNKCLMVGYYKKLQTAYVNNVDLNETIKRIEKLEL